MRKLLITLLVSFVLLGQQNPKYLILHDMGHGTVDPDRVVANITHIRTLPIQGLMMYVVDTNGGNNISFAIMQPTAISYATINAKVDNATAAIAGSSNLIKNFLLAYTPNEEDVDIFDDTKWAIVAQNMANLAQSALANNYTGIAIDNENYDGFFDWSATSYGCDSDLHTLPDCMNKMRLRGIQIIEAIQSTFPAAEILLFHNPTVSDRAFFDHHPGLPNVNGSNELSGSFTVGLAQGNTGTARIINGGEIHKTSDYLEVQDFYRWARYHMADDSYETAGCASPATISCAMGTNGFIPSGIRASWSNLVSGGLHTRANDWFDGAGTTIDPLLDTVIRNNLIRVDKYAWLYMDVGSNPHGCMICDPATDSAHAVTQDFLDEIAAGQTDIYNGGAKSGVKVTMGGKVAH